MVHGAGGVAHGLVFGVHPGKPLFAPAQNVFGNEGVYAFGGMIGGGVAFAHLLTGFCFNGTEHSHYIGVPYRQW